MSKKASKKSESSPVTTLIFSDNFLARILVKDPPKSTPGKSESAFHSRGPWNGNDDSDFFERVPVRSFIRFRAKKHVQKIRVGLPGMNVGGPWTESADSDF